MELTEVLRRIDTLTAEGAAKFQAGISVLVFKLAESSENFETVDCARGVIEAVEKEKYLNIDGMQIDLGRMEYDPSIAFLAETEEEED